MRELDILGPPRRAGALREVDYHLTCRLLGLATKPTASVALAIAALSSAQSAGNTCLDLAACADRRVLDETSTGGSWDGITAPPLCQWRAELVDSGLVGTSAEADMPLVLDTASRLYLSKYYTFEQGIAAGLLARAAAAPLAEEEVVDRALGDHFLAIGPDEVDPYQLAAARIALTRQLAVITGGPGTGKTTTVTRILAAMVDLALKTGKVPPRIRLAAPTGKAAARLGESIRSAKERMPDQDLAFRIPENALTLHRLIGTRPDTRRPWHHAANPLALDLLVIDEASMIDVPLMARVVSALPPHARLILLGDADQLASVEAGAVLGDICRGPSGTFSSSALIRGSIATLKTSHRFAAHSGIGALAGAINVGDATRFLAVCKDDPAVSLVPGSDHAVREAIIATSVDAFRGYLQASDVVDAMRQYTKFRVLCALRDGPWGAAEINVAIERAIAAQGLADTSQRFWRGRPLLITANDYGIQLFNGDIGLAWPDEAGAMRACFVGADGSVRWIPLSRLPAHETAFAMTVHKSQGSEFDRVALVFPNSDAPVLTRELVYTAVTRARRSVGIFGPEALLVQAIHRPVARSSGLKDALWI